MFLYKYTHRVTGVLLNVFNDSKKNYLESLLCSMNGGSINYKAFVFLSSLVGL